jgi:hypothetical protein
MKNILSTLLLLSSVLVAFADDGGTSNFRDWTYGNIYVKEPNDKIALRKELMEVDTDSLKAVFVFENTTDEDVVVDCAFPVRVVLTFYVSDDDSIRFYNYEPELSPKKYWDIALGMNNEIGGSFFSASFSMTFSELKEKADKKMKKWTMDEYKQYLSDLNVLNNSFYSKGCDIVQDGEVVSIENVAMETTVERERDEGSLIVTLHFHHKLKFPKGKESLVVISHDMEQHYQSYKGTYENFYYDISTGGTWKGEMEAFVVVTPFEMKSDSTEFEVIDSKVNIYSIKGYKPKPKESLFFERVTEVEFELVKFPYSKKYKSERYDLKASADILNPNHLNDGDIYTYTTTEDWENSWLEITFDSHVVGPLIVNGLCAERKNQEVFFKEFGDDDWGGLIFDIPCEYKDTLWNIENRVKTVTLTNVKTSEVKTFELSDEYTALASSRGWETSNCVKELEVLEPGTYRMKIKGIYKGENATKTGVSELWFFPIPTLHQILSEDTGSEHPIFGEVPKIVDANLSNIPFRSDVEARPRDYIESEESEESSDSEPDSAILNEQEEPIAKVQVETETADSTLAFALFAVVGALVLIVIAFFVVRKKKHPRR